MRVVEDLQRNRLTVFFRLILAIPHLLWLAIWGFGVLFLSVIGWFAVLFTAKLPDGLHRFFVMYLRYATHVYSYLYLAANPFPGFLGDDGYEVDVRFPPVARQSRWKAAFRLILAIPAFVLAFVLGSGVGGGASSTSDSSESFGFQLSGTLAICAILVWFYALFKGRAPEGVARLQWYSIHYLSQVGAYALLVTERYPTTDPETVGVPWPAPKHPAQLTREADDGSRSRLTVFFRLLLAFPHFVWLLLWSVAVFFVAIANWLVTLIRGRSPDALHRFMAAYLRYYTHVFAFVFIVANPFPGFAGAAGSYPVDIGMQPPERQNRWTTGFRLILAFPAFILNGALFSALWIAGVFGWWVALFSGRMPDGLRKLGLFALRYNAQTNAYGYLLLTDRYPYAGPPA